MAKRLVLSAIETILGDVTFWVSEQTHRCDDFGDGSDKFTASNGLVILSFYCPTMRSDDETLCVRGRGRNRDFDVMHVNAKAGVRIRTAVAEYNAHFADKPEPAESSVMPPILTIQ